MPLTTILKDATVPAGEFGTTTTIGVLGVIQFTNHSNVPGVIKIVGSNDTKEFGRVRKPLKAAPGETIIRRVRLPTTLKFFNPSAPFGPVSLILNQE